MNSVILAPAGGKKTQQIIDMCSGLIDSNKRAVITYTTTAQKVLCDRLSESESCKEMPVIMGWYSFLLDHVVRPYVSAVPLFKDVRIRGLHWIDGTLPRGLSGIRFYLNSAHDVYSERLGLLASKVIEVEASAIIDRLERIFDEIYIDEVQDLRGNDLDILDMLLSSKIKIVMVGDVRQRLLSTSKSSTKNKKYDGLGLVEWFQERAERQMLDIKEIRETWRCCPEVIQFADRMFPSGLFPETRSNVVVPEGVHHGVWLVERSHIDEYIKLYSPACYRDSIRTKISGTASAINFGHCKGATEDHVLIFPTGTLRDFWKGKKGNLANKSRMNAYVAITRARWSVAICVDDVRGYSLPIWKPDPGK